MKRAVPSESEEGEEGNAPSFPPPKGDVIARELDERYSSRGDDDGQWLEYLTRDDVSEHMWC